RDPGLGALRGRQGRDSRHRQVRRIGPRRRSHAGAGVHRRRRRRRSQTGAGRNMITRSAVRPIHFGGQMRRSTGALLVTLVVALTASASAADLPSFLPAEAIAAVGVEGLAQHEAKAQPFIDEWNRLNLTELLET